MASLCVTWSIVTDTRDCEQCGASFAPRHEHARFCSARCRVAWNRLHAGGSPAEGGALDWTISAMRDTIDRLLLARCGDQPHAFAVISEAVWWVTMVDADAWCAITPTPTTPCWQVHDVAGRREIEGTFGGLRFVRNQMGYYLDHADFIQPGRALGTRPIAAWTWRSLPEPGLDPPRPRGQEWEMTRYGEYQAWLAGQPVGDTFLCACAPPAGLGQLSHPPLAADRGAPGRPAKTGIPGTGRRVAGTS